MSSKAKTKKGAYPKAQEQIAEKKDKILYWLSRAFSRAGAAAKAGCSYTQMLKYIKEDVIFAQEVQSAIQIGTDCLEDVATSRAKRRSDVLLMFLLKKRDPSFRDKQEINIVPVEVRVKRFAK